MSVIMIDASDLIRKCENVDQYNQALTPIVILWSFGWNQNPFELFGIFLRFLV